MIHPFFQKFDHKFTIKQKMMMAFLGIGLLPIFIVSVIAFVVSKDALSSQVFRDLASVRDVKTAQVTNFFKERKTDLNILLETVDSLRDVAFDKLRSVQENKKALIEHRFEDLRKNVLYLSKSVLLLQALKDFGSTIDGKGNFDWILYNFFEREKYASSLREFVSLYDFYDLMLLSPKGQVLYSVKKEADLGMNLFDDFLLDRTISDRIMTKKEREHTAPKGVDETFIFDFKPYPLSNSPQPLALMGSPIRGKDGTVSGILIVKITPDIVNKIVQRREGMGVTGETYIASASHGTIALRSDRLVKPGLFGDPLVDDHIESVLTHRMMPFIRIGDTGISELVAYDALDIEGLDWVMVSVMDLEEAIDPRKTPLTDDFFSRYVDAYPIENLYLISSDGIIFYSAQKDKEIKTRQIPLNAKASPLASIYKKVIKTHAVSFVDFTRFEYGGSPTPYAFLGAPLIYEDQIELIVVLQISVAPFNEMMKIGDSAQMSKEVYLIGSDQLLRSNSRLLPDVYSVDQSLMSPDLIRIDTVPAIHALAGQRGTTIAQDYRDITVFSAYCPLNIMDVEWGVIAEIDQDEAHASLKLFSFIAFLFAILATFGIVVISLWISKRLTSPILSLKNAVNRLRYEDFSGTHSTWKNEIPRDALPQYTEHATDEHQEIREKKYDPNHAFVGEIESNDELRLLAEAFNEMAFTIRNNAMILEQKITLLEKADTEAKRTQAELMLTDNVFKNTIEGIVITDPSGSIQRVNRAFTEITGYTEEEAIGQNPRILRSDRHSSEFYQQMWEKLLDGGQWSGEIWNRRKDGSAYPEWLSISSLKNDQGDISHFISLFHDISEIKMREEELQFLAFHDPLTQLPNRKLFYDRAKVALRTAKRFGRKMGLLYMDMDNFKTINDAYGHPFGDEFLCSVKEIISSICRESDTFARYGGDEFVIILNNLKTSHDAIDFSERVIDLFKAPLNVREEKIYTSISIGLSVFPDDGDDIVTLEKNADMALYEAKRRGKRNTFRYRQNLEDEMLRKVSLERRLRDAIVDFSSFKLFYQPKVDIVSHTIYGVEALLRWLPDGEMISPADFIPIAEETNMIIPLGEWIIHQAMSDIKTIHDHFDTSHEIRPPTSSDYSNLPIANADNGKKMDDAPWRPYLSINLSGKQFNDGNLFNIIEGALKESGYDRSRLIFEITESIPMHNTERSIKIMNRFNDMGMALSIDDFGTGYSSLSYLKRFPIHELKIDRSFIKDLPDDKLDAAISQTIITMANNLNFQVVAEGVETREQLMFLKDHGCRLIQGFLFYKPLPINALQDVMETVERDGIPIISS